MNDKNIEKNHKDLVKRTFKNPNDIISEWTVGKDFCIREKIAAVISVGKSLENSKKWVFNNNKKYEINFNNSSSNEPIDGLPFSYDQIRMASLHAAVGIAGEAIELLSEIKLRNIDGEIDINKVIKELGDLEYYIEALRQSLDISRLKCLYENQVKLDERYSEGSYSDEAAQERKDVK